MSKIQDKNTERIHRRLNLSTGHQSLKSSFCRLKSKITQVFPMQYENKVKLLESTRKSLQKKKKSGQTTIIIDKPQLESLDANDIIHIKKSSSFQTNSPGSDLNTFECADMFKTSDTSKIASTSTINIKCLNLSNDTQVNLNRLLDSPLQKIPRINEIDIEKTPVFRASRMNSTSKAKKYKDSNTKQKLSGLPEKSKKDEGLNNLSNDLFGKRSASQDKNIEKFMIDEQSFLEQDSIVKTKIKELNSENERKVKYLEDHISKLSKENERMASIINGKKAAEEVKKIINLVETPTDVVLDSNRAFIALSKAYEEIRQENKRLQQLSKVNYCSKCRAFIDTNSELSNKLLRLRNYLNTE